VKSKSFMKKRTQRQMKIINNDQEFGYIILKSFFFRDHELKVGEKVTLPNDIGIQATFAGKVRPILPPITKYKALRNFPFTLKNKKIEIKSGEILEVKAEDALYLLLKGWVFPCDKSIWRPFKLHEKKRYQFQELFSGTRPRGIIEEIPQEAVKKKPFATSWIKDDKL
jgi:hypothetical protein